MASFQAKIGWKMQKIEKIRIIIPFCSNPTHKRKLQKNSKKIQKIKKYHYGVFSNQNRLEKAENRENKNYRYVLFLPDGVEKIPKK